MCKSLCRMANKMVSTTMHAAAYKYQPPVNRQMRDLDRSFFVTRVPLCVVKFADPQNISIFAKEFKEYILRVPRIPHVIKLGTSEDREVAVGAKRAKTLACDNGIVAKGVLLTDTIRKPEEANNVLSQEALNFLAKTNAQIFPYEYVLDYNFWKADEILRAVLPEEFLDEIPTGFTITGHIAHLNLRKEFKPYDTLIGQVILDKNNKIECVVDKVSSIASQFRTFPMKVIAGSPNNLIVEQKESNCTFRFDFSKVYWNSRLHTEHERLVQEYFNRNEVVCDVFAGVGPFAIPAAKKDVIVLANDLNPESYKYLRENVEINKVSDLVRPYNLDGAKFIREAPRLLQDWIHEQPEGKIRTQTKLKKRSKSQPRKEPQSKDITIPFHINHFVMNLPDSSISFLGNFNGLYKNIAENERPLQQPWIHVHCFEKYSNDETPSLEELHKRVFKRIIESLNTTEDILHADSLKFHLVRKVSPTKPMFCVSFQLPKQLMY